MIIYCEDVQLASFNKTLFQVTSMISSQCFPSTLRTTAPPATAVTAVTLAVTVTTVTTVTPITNCYSHHHHRR